jgi:hypothetical protein
MHLLNTIPQRLDPGATPTFAGLIAPSLTSPASTDLTLAAGGTNQNVVLTPSGTGGVTVSTGNLIIGTAGKGIDFSATSGTGSSELLNDYEEGTWTPAYISTGATFAYTEQYGSYVKVGSLVTLQMRLRPSSVIGTTSNDTYVTGLPFASANLNLKNTSAGAVGLCNVTGGLAMTIDNNEGTYLTLWNFATITQPIASSLDGKYFNATISYRTA